MQNISETVNSLDFLSRRHAQETQKTLDSVSVDIVNRLFVFFEAICRGFEKQYRDHQAKLNMEKIQWARGFMDYGITNIEQIELGIKKCRLESPINTPTLGQFLKWCHPEPQDVGLPILEKAYEISIQMNQQFSNYKPSCKKTYTVLQHVINQIGSTEYRSMSAEKAFKIFERYYPITCKQFVEGRLEEIRKALPQKVDLDSFDKEKANRARLEAMDAIRKMGISINAR